MNTFTLCMYILQHRVGDRGGRRAKRDNTRYLPPKHPSVKSLHRNVSSPYVPSSSGRHRSRDSNTVQSNHANRHRHFHIYIYIIYNHKNLYVQLIWQEIKWATLSKLNFVLFWGVFITEIRFFSVSWVDVGMWFSRSLCVTSQGRAPVSQRVSAV